MKKNWFFSVQSNIYKSIGYYGNYENIQNQLRVLKSRDLVRATLNKLDFDVSYHIVGRIRTTEALSGVPFKVTGVCNNSQMYEKEIFIEFLQKDYYLVRYEVGGINKELKGKFGVKLTNEDLSFVLTNQFDFTEEFLNKIRAVNYYFSFHHQENLVNKYTAAIQTTNIENTSIIEITVEDIINEKAILFLDTLSRVYVEQTVYSKYSISERTIYSIQQQLDTVTNILGGIEDTLQLFVLHRNYKDH